MPMLPEPNHLLALCTGKKRVTYPFGKVLHQDALIMNIDDLLCVGAVDNILFHLLGRNKLYDSRRVISRHHQQNRLVLAELP